MSMVPTYVQQPHHTDLHPSNVFLTSWFILSVLFLTGGETSVVPTHVQDPCYMDLHSGRNVYLTSWFILSVLFLTGGETSVVLHYTCLPGILSVLSLTGSGMSLHVSRIPHHMDLHPGRNVFYSSRLFLSVLFLTGGETSVVPTCLPDPLSHGPPLQ